MHQYHEYLNKEEDKIQIFYKMYKKKLVYGSMKH